MSEQQTTSQHEQQLAPQQAMGAPSSNTAPAPERKELFADFSVAQVFASSLSAVTSVLLSQQIGVIGGLLGVAIGAAVATIATQAYRSILSVSAERIREQMSANAAGELQGQDTAAASESSKLTRQQHLRGVALVALASLVAVGLLALIINAATQGQGLGEKVSILEPIDITPEVSIEAPGQETSGATQTEAESTQEASTTETGTQLSDSTSQQTGETQGEQNQKEQGSDQTDESATVSDTSGDSSVQESEQGQENTEEANTEQNDTSAADEATQP